MAKWRRFLALALLLATFLSVACAAATPNATGLANASPTGTGVRQPTRGQSWWSQIASAWLNNQQTATPAPSASTIAPVVTVTTYVTQPAPTPVPTAASSATAISVPSTTLTPAPSAVTGAAGATTLEATPFARSLLVSLPPRAGNTERGVTLFWVTNATAIRVRAVLHENMGWIAVVCGTVGLLDVCSASSWGAHLHLLLPCDVTCGLALEGM